MINIDELTVKQIREIAAMAPKCAKPSGPPLPFGIGDKVLIRTVTMYQLGVVKAIGRDFITLEDGGWAADLGRFGQALATGSISEFERAPSWFLVGQRRGPDHLHPRLHPRPPPLHAAGA